MARDPYVCSGCDRRFKSLRAFDGHRPNAPGHYHDRNDVVCVDPATIQDAAGVGRYSLNGHGEWIRARTDLESWEALTAERQRRRTESP